MIICKRCWPPQAPLLFAEGVVYRTETRVEDTRQSAAALPEIPKYLLRPTQASERRISGLCVSLFGDVDPLRAALELPHDADASMLLRRLKVYRFMTRVPKPTRTVPYCGHCFSKLLLSQSAAWRAQPS